MAITSINTTEPIYSNVTQAIDAIVRARAIGQGLNVTLANSADERSTYLIQFILTEIADALDAAEGSLTKCLLPEFGSSTE